MGVSALTFNINSLIDVKECWHLVLLPENYPFQQYYLEKMFTDNYFKQGCFPADLGGFSKADGRRIFKISCYKGWVAADLSRFNSADERGVRIEILKFKISQKGCLTRQPF